MIDLKKLEAERERATRDKADLFDFYHENWDTLVEAYRHYYTAAMLTEHNVQQTIGGYLYGYDDGTPLWGDHVAETLAVEAVERLKKQEVEIARLQCELSDINFDRPIH